MSDLSKDMKDRINAVYYSIWKGIVEKEDGTLDKDLVKRELYDFSILIQNVQEVYDHITDGKIKNPEAPAKEVKLESDKVLADIIRSADVDNDRVCDKIIEELKDTLSIMDILAANFQNYTEEVSLLAKEEVVQELTTLMLVKANDIMDGIDSYTAGISPSRKKH